MVETNFNAKDHEPNRSFDPLPPGKYNAMIVKSEKVETKAKDGHYLKFQFKIIDGKYKNRVVFTNLNLWNKNPTAVEIANSDLSAICHATKVFKLKDTQQLHGKPLEIKLRIRAAEGNFEASNDIKGYAPAGSGVEAPEFTENETPADSGGYDAPDGVEDEVPAWARD